MEEDDDEEEVKIDLENKFIYITVEKIEGIEESLGFGIVLAFKDGFLDDENGTLIAFEAEIADPE